MTDADAHLTRVTGGGRVELPYEDVLALAGLVEETGHRTFDGATRAGAVAVSPDLAISAPFSPVTAAAAEAAVLALGTTLTAWSGAIVLDAHAVRHGARLLADADEAARLGLHHLEVAIAALDGRERIAPEVRRTDLVVSSPTAPTAPGAPAVPRDLAELVDHLGRVSDLSDGDHPDHNGTVEVQTVTGADGRRRHIAYLPGLDDLNPISRDGDVRDASAALALEAGLPTAYGAGVVRALHDAGVAPEEEVLLVGHSQGGMQAAALAVQGTPYRLTQVVTAGSPAVPGHLPPGVHLLALEHLGDPVPLFDAGESDDAPGHVTVTFDDGIDGLSHLTGNHELTHYVAGARAVQHSTDPTVRQAVAGLGRFLAQPGDQVESTVFRIVRGDGAAAPVPPAPPAAGPHR